MVSVNIDLALIRARRHRAQNTISEDLMDLQIDGMAPLLQVFDMPTSLRFYRDVLGFEVISD